MRWRARTRASRSPVRPELDEALYSGFNERLRELLAANMVLQAQAGADCVAIFDTAAGTLDPARFARAVAGPVAEVMRLFRARCPHTPVIYYSRDTGPAHWSALQGVDLQCLGIDWRHDLAQTLQQQHAVRWSVQGNIDPQWLLLPAGELERRVRARIRAGARAARSGAGRLDLRAGTRRAAAHAGDEREAGAPDPAGDVWMTAGVSDALVAKYDVAGPRYTSYPTVPYWERTPSESEWLEHLSHALAEGREHGAALYLHIPFCRSLCTFCGCNTRITRSHSFVPPYTQTLLAELDLYRARLGLRAARVR